MIILAIETSCDETSIALVRKRMVIDQATISQIFEQRKHGGVVPDLAAKLHIKNIQRVLSRIIEKNPDLISKIDYVAYTSNPGLKICLQIGKAIAETISIFYGKKIIPCNHLEAHVYSSLVNNNSEWSFPSLAVLVSGGHTQLYSIEKHLSFKLIGETLDDAAGECLDKSAILMGFDYPGGPIIEKLAKSGSHLYKLSVPKNDQSLDFSFSGLKSQVYRLVKSDRSNLDISSLAFSIQYTVCLALIKKIRNAFKKKSYKSVVFGGGVVLNNFIRSYLISNIHSLSREIEVFFHRSCIHYWQCGNDRNLSLLQIKTR